MFTELRGGEVNIPKATIHLAWISSDYFESLLLPQ